MDIWYALPTEKEIKRMEIIDRDIVTQSISRAILEPPVGKLSIPRKSINSRVFWAQIQPIYEKLYIPSYYDRAHGPSYAP